MVANGIGLAPGDNVVIDELHFPTEFVLYRALEKSRGIELRIARHRHGVVDASDFEPHVDRRTRLVSVAWVSHLNGFRHDMRPIADLAHAHGALFYADAIQAVGMFPVDVRAAGVDFLCCGTYKWLLAGFGVAPFFIRRELIDRIRPDRFGWGDIARELPDYHPIISSRPPGGLTTAVGRSALCISCQWRKPVVPGERRHPADRAAQHRPRAAASRRAGQARLQAIHASRQSVFNRRGLHLEAE